MHNLEWWHLRLLDIQGAVVYNRSSCLKLMAYKAKIVSQSNLPDTSHLVGLKGNPRDTQK